MAATINNIIPDVSTTRRRFEHPFTELYDWDRARYQPDHTLHSRHSPRTLIEYRMCALSAAIRDKKDWYLKFRDDAIRETWKREIKGQQQGLHPSLQLTDNMLNYIMGELEAYAAIRDPETGIQPGPYEQIWQSDDLIPAPLTAALKSAIAPLESLPEDQKDWHPRSDGRVLDLVHPSLYPVIYGRTVSKASGTPLQPRPSDVNDMFISRRFQWLPSDFDVAEDGTVTLVSPYINNIHPEEHQQLMNIIPQVLEKAVPMFEWVLSDLAREQQLPTRLDYRGENTVPCVWHDEEPQPDDAALRSFYAMADCLSAILYKPLGRERDRLADAAYALWLETHDENDPGWVEPRYEPLENWEDKSYRYYTLCRDRWLDAQPHIWPDSKPAYDGGLKGLRKTVDLRGRRLQVIVKLANIMLTPEKPRYVGGTWHVEGMDNEAIVSTFIYYYDCENITQSTLSFRTATSEPEYHRQWDYYCMERLYGLGNDDICVQHVSAAVTREGRCIAFPNIYQHLVSPFSLRDKTKPGHRKILVFFLVDPNVSIPSASDVGPQQEAWIRAAIEGTQPWQRLPPELQEIIWEELGAVTDEQARAYREELMNERTAFVGTVNGQRFGNTFNLCEH